ncbi:hypothetical protein KAM474_29370 [Aeromonas caviae]|nr:hypothetical protein KAM474_29370 [Aeromonas caviae]
MSVLVIAEHHQGRIADNLAQLVTAAGRLGGEVHLLLCLLYTSDAADEEDSVDLGGRRIIKKKSFIPF